MDNQLEKESKKQETLKAEFFSAVMKGSIDEVVATLEQGVDLNSLTFKGNNALFVAASRKQREMFEWLLSITQKGIPLDINNKDNAGNPLLFTLIKEGGLTYYIEKLIEKNVAINLTNKEMISPLIQACADKKIEEINLLLSVPSIDINYQSPKTNISAFLMACDQSSMKIVQNLLDHGADPTVMDSEKKNALINLLFKSTQHYSKVEKKEHQELLQYLIHSGIDIDYVAPTGVSAFWLASRMKEKEACLSMLEKNVNVNVTHKLFSDIKSSALHIWLMGNDKDMVEKLLEHGAKLGVLDSNNNAPEAYGFLMPGFTELMLQYNADVNTIYHDTSSKKGIIKKIPAATLVISQGDQNFEIVEEMINRGMKITYPEKSFESVEPIFYAISEEAHKIATLLLNMDQIDVNRQIKFSKNIESMSLLSFLISGITAQNFEKSLGNNSEILEILQAVDVESSGLQDEEWNRLKEEVMKLNNDVYAGKKEIFNLILEKGGKINSPNELGHTEIFFAKLPIAAQWLEEANANIFHEDQQDRDVLYYSILNDNSEIILHWKEKFTEANHATIDNLFYQLAFEDYSNSYIQRNVVNGIINYLDDKEIKNLFNKKNPDKITTKIHGLEYVDDYGNTPLIVAAERNASYLVNVYLTLGANINAQNNMGETAIMHALLTKNYGLIQELINQNADVNITKFDGTSLLDIAKELGNTVIIKMIETKLNPEAPLENKILEESKETTIAIKPKSFKV